MLHRFGRLRLAIDSNEAAFGCRFELMLAGHAHRNQPLTRVMQATACLEFRRRIDALVIGSSPADPSGPPGLADIWLHLGLPYAIHLTHRHKGDLCGLYCDEPHKRQKNPSEPASFPPTGAIGPIPTGDVFH
jgi:hypothetical protein